MAKAPKDAPLPTHPGEHLRLLILPNLLGRDIPKGAFAERLGVTHEALDNLVSGKTNMTPSMALRLSRVLGSPPEFWMGLQAAYDLAKAQAAMGGQLAALTPLSAAKARS